MAVTPQSIALAIQAAGPTMFGPSWIKTTSAIGVGVHGWSVFPGNVAMAGVTTGTLGVGVVTGKILVPPDPTAFVVGSMALVGLVGPTSAKMGAAIGIGIGTAYSAAGQYVGVCAGAVGADASKIVWINPILAGTLLTAFAAHGMIGPSTAKLIAGITPGILSLFLTGGGVGMAAGPTVGIAGIGGSVSTPVF